MKFNGVEITQEAIQATRQWYADNAQACIDEVLSGEFVLPSHVKFEDYKTKCYQNATSALAGEYDRSFAFMQRAYFIQTGESVAFLPK